jgi:hypothetical protein
MAVVAAVIPLAVVQIPDAIAWALPPRLADAGPAMVASLLRVSGLALPAMAIAAPLAALAVRRMRAGPVLLAGLLVIAAADVAGGIAHTVLEIGADRSMHGLGAGIVLAATAAIVAEQQQQQARRVVAGWWARVLAGWWAAVTVAGLAAAPELMRHRVVPGDWRAALQPYPWLTGTALALAALYAVLAESTAATAARSAFPVAERAQLALLATPVAGICAIALAVTYRSGNAVVAAAVTDAIALAGIAAITARAGTAARFAVVCAVTGFTLAPTAAAVTALAQPTAESGYAVLAAALGGAALALMARPESRKAVTSAGLLLAAAGFGAMYLTEGRNSAALLCAAGLAAALTSSLRATGAAGAMAGVVILLAGVVAGDLAVGSVQLRALTGAPSAPAMPGALAAATGRWLIIAAAVTAAVGLALASKKRAGKQAEQRAGKQAGKQAEQPADRLISPTENRTPPAAGQR